MKKLAIIAILASMAAAASATDFGLRIGRNTATETNNAGITIGQKFDNFGVEGSYDRMVSGNSNSRYSVLGTYDFAKFDATTVTAKAGAAYIDPALSEKGYAGLAGVGVSYALSKTVSLTGEYLYQKGQSKTVSLDGNLYSAGVKYSF